MCSGESLLPLERTCSTRRNIRLCVARLAAISVSPTSWKAPCAGPESECALRYSSSASVMNRTMGPELRAGPTRCARGAGRSGPGRRTGNPDQMNAARKAALGPGQEAIHQPAGVRVVSSGPSLLVPAYGRAHAKEHRMLRASSEISAEFCGGLRRNLRRAHDACGGVVTQSQGRGQARSATSAGAW
jgi:hypothetical protein